MEKKAARISIPDEEWKFDKTLSPELCFVWESLRCIKKPKKAEIAKVVARIVVFASSNNWFQLFCRRYRFKPLALLAWVDLHKKWPSSPWATVKSEILPVIERYECLPALVDLNQPAIWEQRYKSELTRLTDIMQPALIYPKMSRERAPEQQENLPLTLQTLMTFGLLCQPNFCINLQNHTRKEVAKEFGKWLEGNWPERLKPLNEGGRVQPSAWLNRLAAYRLYRFADGKKDLLDKRREAFKNHFPSADHSLEWCARDFFTSILTNFLPPDLLPDSPMDAPKTRHRVRDTSPVGSA